MPPRTRRQSPERRDAAIRKHLPKAREYWTKWPAYLAEGDLCQAGEKGWGAVAQLAKSVASYRGWAHSGHEEIRAVIRQLADESEDRDRVRRSLMHAEMLHGNFYEINLDRTDTELALEDAEYLLAVLWNEMPDTYTGGTSFDDWIASGDN